MKSSHLTTKNIYLLLFFVLAAAAAAFLALNSSRVWQFTADDSFITFRYARNLARGIGPTFNAAGMRAEGYTSVLWMLVMALPHILGFGVVSFSKLSGVLAMLGTLAWLVIFIDRAAAAQGRRYALIAAGLVAFFFGVLPETAVHAVSGMETAGYTFLLTGLVTLTYLAVTGSRSAMDWLPLMALLTGLMRPEGNLVSILMLLVVGLSGAPRRRFWLRVAVLYVLPGALYFLWRWRYFGVLLPLPFYVKMGGYGSLPGLLTIVTPFLLFVLANLGLPVGIGLFGERKAVGILLLAILPDLGFFLLSYPVMEYNYRFAFPLLPLVLALVGMGLALILKQSENWLASTRWQWIAPTGVVLFSLLMFMGQNIPRQAAMFKDKLAYAQAMTHAHYAIGHALNQAPHDGKSPVLAVTDAGAIPYFSDWRTIDGGGLNDPSIALERVNPVDYIYQQNPDVVVLTSTSPDVFQSDSPYYHDLYTRGLNAGLVVVARTLFYQGEGDSIWVLARPGSAAARQLSALK